MFGFIITITMLGIIIFVCCQYFNISYIKENYKRLSENCARSTANALFNMPVDKYLKSGKTDLYNEQLATVISICKNFNLKYLYVYVPDFNNNEVTSIFYVDGKTRNNMPDRDLGTVVTWKITQQERDAFRGKEDNKMYRVNNHMGHTITSYAVVRNSDGKPIALVGADLDFNIIKKELLKDFIIIVSFIILSLLIIYISLIAYLNKVFIAPVVKFSQQMKKFSTEKYENFVPLPVETDDEFGMMVHSFNIMVKDIKEYMQSVSDTQMETIFSLAKLAQSRDDDTGKHLERVQNYCSIIARDLKENSPYADQMDSRFIENLVNASSLHDIGKVGISDSILLKPGKYTPEEFEIMKRHTIIGYRTLSDVNSKFGKNAFIDMGMTIAIYHHERWDGKGYPLGLKGDEIPLAARIMALADVYDAISTKRVYKTPFPKEECIKIIVDGSGTQFDPVLIESFLRVADELYDVRCSFED